MTTAQQLKLRGAAEVLRHALDYVDSKPGWSYPEIDRYGHYADTQDALDILRPLMNQLGKESRR